MNRIADGTPLSDYKLTEGSKLNLVVKRREEAKAQASSAASSAGGQEGRSQNSSDNSSTGASSKTAKPGRVTGPHPILSDTTIREGASNQILGGQIGNKNL